MKNIKNCVATHLFTVLQVERGLSFSTLNRRIIFCGQEVLCLQGFVLFCFSSSVPSAVVCSEYFFTCTPFVVLIVAFTAVFCGPDQFQLCSVSQQVSLSSLLSVRLFVNLFSLCPLTFSEFRVCLFFSLYNIFHIAESE